MNGARALFFVVLRLFGLYAVEFGVVGILPAIVQRHGISVAQAGWLQPVQLYPWVANG